MAEKRNHNKQYTASDIEKYWTGKLTPAEMHAMEKTALEDPFLADAMEGYSKNADNTGRIEEDLTELRSRIEHRTSGRHKGGIISRWWKVAAAAIIVIGIGSFSYYLLNRQDDSRLAQEPATRKQEELPRPADTIQKVMADSPPSPEFAKPSLPPKIKSRAKTPNIIYGVVTDHAKQPVAGAMVALEGRIPGIVVTDSAGRFKLPASDSALSLNVASAGYLSVNRQVEKAEASKEIQIELQPADAALSEVVVTGYGVKKSKAAKRTENIADSTATGAEPVNGWDAFHRYINANRQVPDSLKQVHGQVELGFSINRLRNITGIEVRKSVHPVLDSLAIKLLENGPRWKPVNGKRTGITVRIGF